MDALVKKFNEINQELEMKRSQKTTQTNLSQSEAPRDSFPMTRNYKKLIVDPRKAQLYDSYESGT